MKKEKQIEDKLKELQNKDGNYCDMVNRDEVDRLMIELLEWILGDDNK